MYTFSLSKGWWKVMCCVLNHLSRVWLFAALWTAVHQFPLSVGFSRQEDWTGLPWCPTRDLPYPGIKPAFLHLLHGRQILSRWERLEIWEKLEISSRKLEITREHFHAKMGSIKDRNGVDLTEAEDIKKRWQEYTEELYKKTFITQTVRMVWSLT